MPTKAVTKKEKTKVTTKKKKDLRLSATMLKTWLQCPLQFQLNYIERLPQPANTSFSLGNAVHHALELANISLMKTHKQFTNEEVEEFVQEFRDYLAKTHLDSMEYFESGATMVRGELLGLDLNERVIDAEVEFDITTPEGVRIYGFIDKVSQVNETTIKITDYKTSKIAMSWDEAKVDEQLSMYDLAATVLYPQFPNRILELKYVRLGQSLTSNRTDIAQFEFRREIASIFKAIKEYRDNPPKQRPDGYYNDKCHWCAYNKKCPAYNQQLSENMANDFVPVTELTDSTAIEELQKVSLREKALKEHKDNVKLWLAQRIENDPETDVTNGTHMINPMCSSRRYYDAEKLASLLTVDQLVEIASVSSTKVTKLLNTISDPDLKREVESAAFVKVGNPQYRIKKR